MSYPKSESGAADRPAGFVVDVSASDPPPYYTAPAQSSYGYGYQHQNQNQAYMASQAPPPGLNQPSATLVSVEEIGYDSGGEFAFSDKSVRRGFIRKVYSILTGQLVITFAVIALFTFVDSVRQWARANYWLYITSLILVVVLVVVLACSEQLRRRYPHNIIFLLLFTLVEGVALGSVCAYFDVMSVWVAAAICIILVFALTLFAMQTRIDFTLMSGCLFACSLCLFITMLLCLLIRTHWSYMLYAGLGACVFSVYIVFDTQLMLGGKHKYSISPEEYIFASLNLYLDIVNLFLYILMLVNGSRRG